MQCTVSKVCATAVYHLLHEPIAYHRHTYDTCNICISIRLNIYVTKNIYDIHHKQTQWLTDFKLQWH